MSYRKQQYDPFHTAKETHCGECNKLLTDAKGNRLESAIFDDGIRCTECYRSFVILNNTLY